MGPLRAAIERQTAHALACGALHPIETAHTFIDDGGVRFAVRVAENLARKEAARLTPHTQPPRDPFLPYERDLFVADLSPTHVALLNKFNVIDRHLLIVTRRYEPQEALLDAADFTALIAAMREIDGLGFYNGGAAAGASQTHKHLQLVPLPLGGEAPATANEANHAPVEALLRDAQAAHGARPIATVPGLRFRHALARLDPGLRSGTPDDAARLALGCYRALLDAVDVPSIDVGGLAHQGAPYNLLITRRWMLVVPRSVECVEGISVNSLGFAGSFFVRNAAQLQTLMQLGPMNALECVSVPR